jgi:hypothetical protein
MVMKVLGRHHQQFITYLTIALRTARRNAPLPLGGPGTNIPNNIVASRMLAEAVEAKVLLAWRTSGGNPSLGQCIAKRRFSAFQRQDSSEGHE